MNRYSKIKLVNSSTKSRSMDFSDPNSFPSHDQTKPIGITTPKFIPRIHKSQSVKKSTTHEAPNSDAQYDYDDGDEQQYYGNQEEDEGSFPMEMLNRNQSVASSGTTTNAPSTTPSSRFKLEKQSSTRASAALQTAVQRAFSMRRSSSVSERYCRIHDQCVTVSAPFDDDCYDEEQEEEEEEEEEEVQKTRSMNKDKKQRKYSRGSMLKACKRFFGL